MPHQEGDDFFPCKFGCVGRMVMGSLIPGSEQVPQIAIDVGARGVGAELFLQREDGLLMNYST